MEVYDILRALKEDGEKSAPRGHEILELTYFHCKISHPWSDYVARDYPLDYYKREMQWYLAADPYDHRICKHATIWEKISQESSMIFSNYGQYWFGKQNGFDWALKTLKNDPQSRQAYIPMCNYHHTFIGNKDVVCTKGIQFRINKYGLLDMHVTMRSTDVIFGMGTDLPCFYTLQCLLADALKVNVGRFHFSSDSVHIYEKHFKLMDRILERDKDDRKPVIMPYVDDYRDILLGTYQSSFGNWLTEVRL